MPKVEVKPTEGLILTESEEKAIITKAQDMYPEFDNIVANVSVNKNGKLQAECSLRGPKFERIRRITGYLVGTIDRWGDAKRAEERDRVKHCTPEAVSA